MKELIEIQSALKAPKNQRNNFGKYNYRSCEDILEAVKPLLKAHNCYITISDEVVKFEGVKSTSSNTKNGDTKEQSIDGILSIKATVTISNKDGLTLSASAFAGIDLIKSGMDAAQTFGASSSYARKYALNGLFAIDDTKDSDTKEVPTQTKSEPKKVATKPVAKPATKKPDNMDNARKLFQKMITEPMFTKDEISTFRLTMKNEIEAGATASDIEALIQMKYDLQLKNTM